MKKTGIIILSIIALSFITGILFYPYLPSVIATHWNAQGAVDGYMSRAWGVFLLPIILLLCGGVLFFIPRIDPKRDNIAKFRKYFDYFVVGLMLLLYYIYLLSLIWNVGYQFDFTLALLPALAAIFYLIGALLPHTQQNWMIGIRTPWTISSESVWRKTHAVGGIAFKICAVLVLFGIFFPKFAPWFILAPLIVTALGLVVYSYFLYQKEQRQK
jgi:uncharacterized membrane protein